MGRCFTMIPLSPSQEQPSLFAKLRADHAANSGLQMRPELERRPEEGGQFRPCPVGLGRSRRDESIVAHPSVISDEERARGRFFGELAQEVARKIVLEKLLAL